MIASTLINKIRRRVHDTLALEGETQPKYTDEFYNDCIDRGIAVLNYDIAKSYTLGTIPTRLEYMLELRATLEMCMIRGAEGATSNIVSDLPELPVQTLALPNGFSKTNHFLGLEGPKYWVNLAKTLEDQYKKLLNAELLLNDDSTSQVQVGYLYRKSLRTGRHSHYVMDKPLTPPDISYELIGNNVRFEWEVIHSDFLSYYAIDRADNPLFDNFVQEWITYDNQVHKYISKNLPLGTYYFRLRLINTNDLESYTPTMEIEIV
jgi:hypothetical protein